MPKMLIASLKTHINSPKKLILPGIAACCVLFILYFSACSYYIGWDTAFYVRTTLHAVENDSMYTLDAATGQLASTLSLRYALSPFYMSSAIFSRLLELHPLLVQNLADGSICVLLAFSIIYRLGLLLCGKDKNDQNKAYLTVIFATVLHLSHASLFTVPVLVCSCSLLWLVKRSWRCLRNIVPCMILSILFLVAHC